MRITALLLALACTLSMGAAVAAAPASKGPAFEPAAKSFKNCTKLNKKYPQGVGKRKAQNKVNGRKTGDRNHKKSNKLYRANKHLDRDKDGVACER